MSASAHPSAPDFVHDARTTLARPDLAEQGLEGILRAGSYRGTNPMQCSVAVTALRTRPEDDEPQEDQLIFGEAFDVLDEQDGWAWGRARRDGYVGWVLMDALSAPIVAPTHRVSAIRTYAYAEPDFRSQPVMLLSLNALVAEEGREGRFVKVARAGWVTDTHLAAFDTFDAEPVAVAERFLGAPYQWGGRESLGLDCSALVQQALYACGQGCPRDTDQQQAGLGHPVEDGPLKRGDLVFWDGHVAIMVDAEQVLHANSHHMAVAVEPLADADARQRAAGSGAPVFRRLAR